MTRIGTDDVARYLTRARASDHRGAIAIALQLLDRGARVQDVLDDLVAAAQRETGRRWHVNEWSVVDEHLVTTTTVAVLEAMAAVARPPSGAGALVVACAEGDWHSLPARLFAEGMRGRGWTVSFLGASAPADHVGQFLARRPPDVLAVSCSLPLHYPGAARLAEVARALAVPVVMGGGGIDAKLERCRPLGAATTASGAADAHLAIGGLDPSATPRAPVALDRSALALDADAPHHAEAALPALVRALPALRSYDDRQLARTREDLAFIVRFAAATLLVQDRTIWTDFVAWHRSLLAARGVPESALLAGVEVLAGQVSSTSVPAARLLEGTIGAGLP